MRIPLTPMHAQNAAINYKMYHEKPPFFSYRELSTVSLGTLLQCLITLTFNIFSLYPVGTSPVSTYNQYLSFSCPCPIVFLVTTSCVSES